MKILALLILSALGCAGQEVQPGQRWVDARNANTTCRISKVQEHVTVKSNRFAVTMRTNRTVIAVVSQAGKAEERSYPLGHFRLVYQISQGVCVHFHSDNALRASDKSIKARRYGGGKFPKEVGRGQITKMATEFYCLQRHGDGWATDTNAPCALPR